jgi:hypothetical protein
MYYILYIYIHIYIIFIYMYRKNVRLHFIYYLMNETRTAKGEEMRSDTASREHYFFRIEF